RARARRVPRRVPAALPLRHRRDRARALGRPCPRARRPRPARAAAVADDRRGGARRPPPGALPPRRRRHAGAPPRGARPDGGARRAGDRRADRHDDARPARMAPRGRRRWQPAPDSRGARMTAAASTLGVDPITFQVLNNAFSSIVDEMGALIQNCAFSIVVADGRDYSGTICNADGDLIASGSTDLPAHLGTIPFTVKGTLEWIGKPKEEYFRPGDIVITNDAYIGGTHNNDIRLIMPVFAGRRIVAFVQNSAHWPDIGGHVPGTFDPNARSSHGEGLIIPPIHLVREGELDRDLVRVILRNVRTNEVAYGDLMAQIGAVRLGMRRLEELIDAYGLELVEREMEALIAYSESLLREEFRRLPDGSYDFTALLDKDPGAESDEPVKVHMTLTIDGDHASYDFSESAPEAKGAINGPRSTTISAAVVATKGVFPWIPMNQGVFKAIDFVLPEGLVCSARYPAPISGMAAAIFPAVTDCVLGTFIQLVPERCMAGPAGIANTVAGGYDPRPGYEREFVVYIWLEGGWGGRPAKRDNHVSMCIYATSATNQPMEQQERL